MKVTVALFAAIITLAPSLCFANNPIQPVPEPATGLLLLAGAAGAAGYRKFRSRRNRK